MLCGEFNFFNNEVYYYPDQELINPIIIDPSNLLQLNSNDNFNIDLDCNSVEISSSLSLENMYLDLNINTNKLEYFDFLYPKKGHINITGKDYLYEIKFLLRNIENMVELTLDKLNGKFTFNLQNNNKPLISFPVSVSLKDPDIECDIKISDISMYYLLIKTIFIYLMMYVKEKMLYVML